jgi:hypothetical protein
VGKKAIARMLPPQFMQQAVCEEWFVNSDNPDVIKHVQTLKDYWGDIEVLWEGQYNKADAVNSRVLLERPRDFLPAPVVKALKALFKLACAAAEETYVAGAKKTLKEAARAEIRAAFKDLEWDYQAAPELVRNLGGNVETWVQSTTALQARLVLAAQNHALDLIIQGKAAQSLLLPTLPGGWVCQWQVVT